MPFFIKKPIEVEARQYDGTARTSSEIMEWISENNHYAWKHDDDLVIDTLEGPHHARPGDWIIKGIKGEFYPCKPDIFEATYSSYDQL